MQTMASTTVLPPKPPPINAAPVSIQQPVGSKPTDNPFPAIVADAKAKEAELQEQAEMAARMDEEAGRTTGAGRPPTPPSGIIFGSRLAGPAARPPPPPEKIRTVEGIKVLPRPEEPDNCCMSYTPPSPQTRCPPRFDVEVTDAVVVGVCTVCGIFIGRILRTGRVRDRGRGRR